MNEKIMYEAIPVDSGDLPSYPQIVCVLIGGKIPMMAQLRPSENGPEWWSLGMANATRIEEKKKCVTHWLKRCESPAFDGWVSVETELPKPEQNVIVSFLSGEKRRTAIGFYTPKYHTEYEGDNEDFGDYSEENGGITYCPEGWYEHTWEHEEHYMMIS